MNFTDVLLNAFAWAIFLIFVVVFIVFVFYTLAYFVRTRREKTGAFKLTFLEIKVPPLNEVEIKAAEQMFSGLMGFKKPYFRALFEGQYRISFEIVSKASGISFYVVVPDELVSLVEKQINGSYPDAEIDIVDPTEVWDRGAYTHVVELKLSGPSYFPIRTFENMGGDPLSTITSSMSKLSEDEVLALQYVISPASDGWRRAGMAFSGRAKAKSSEGKGGVDSEFLKGVEKEVSKAGFNVKIRVISISKDKISGQNHARNLVSSFEQFTNVSYTKFKKVRTLTPFNLVQNFIYRRLNARHISIPFLDIQLYRNTSLLNTEELATVFHFPNKNVQTPGIVWLTARRASAPVNLPSSGMYLGKSIFRDVRTKVHITPEDRVRHMYIIGQTGTGKSQFMMSCVLQDIINGEGVAVIDPHGSDVIELMEKIPPNRLDDVIMFDAGDVERPIGLNILEADTIEERHLVINSFIGMLYKLYDPNKQGIMGPQLERAIRNVMLTAMEDKESTLVDVLRLLIDTKYSQTFLPKITDPIVKKYWTEEMAKTNDFHKSEKMGYFVSKFDRFVTERILRNIVGQPRTVIDFKKFMAEKKILLCDLSKGKIGEENSNFVGLILIQKILTAALSRSTQIQEGTQFPHYYLYVDEFQNFATDDFATILSEARKYKLNLIVAHQFISQLPDKIKDAIFGNVGTICAFRVGADDAKFLETQFDPVFKQGDLMNNPTGAYYIKLLVKNQPMKPFSVTVDWDMITATKKDTAIAKSIRENSRIKYGTPIAEVDEFIAKRMGLNDKAELDAPVSPFSRFGAPKPFAPRLFGGGGATGPGSGMPPRPMPSFGSGSGGPVRQSPPISMPPFASEPLESDQNNTPFSNTGKIPLKPPVNPLSESFTTSRPLQNSWAKAPVTGSAPVSNVTPKIEPRAVPENEIVTETPSSAIGREPKVQNPEPSSEVAPSEVASKPLSTQVQSQTPPPAVLPKGLSIEPEVPSDINDQPL